MHRQLIRLISILILLSVSGHYLAQDDVFPEDNRLLVWLASGSQPGRQNPQTPGEIALMSGDGTTETLLTLDANTIEHVMACGNNGWSLNHEYFAFFTGRDTGSLHMIDQSTQTLQTLENDIANMVCVGDDTLRFSPDSSQIAYLAYPEDFLSASTPLAQLTLKTVADAETVTTIDGTGAFTIENEQLAYTTYSLNVRDEATELIVNIFQDGSSKEIASVEAGNNCFFNSSSMVTVGDELIVIAGHLCQVGSRSSNWQIYRVSPENQTLTLAAADEARGGYRPTARNNQVWLSPDAQRVYFTIPDGISNNTVSISMFDLETEAVTSVMDRFAIMHSTATRPYLINNHSAVLSANGQFLAAIRNNANNDAFLSVLDFDAPDLPPIELSTSERGDVIGELLFTPDASQLIFSAGSDADRDTNAMSLFNLNPISGGDFRLTRGRYGQGVMSPAGTHIVIVDRSHLGETRPYSNLILVNLDTGEELTLFVGADFEENRATNRRFAYPLAWFD